MGSNQRKKQQLKKQIIILIIAVVTLVFGFQELSAYMGRDSVACGKFVSDSKSASPRICLEIARTEGERARGLMYRKPGELAENQGMLFVFKQEENNAFWMKDTYISLDMIHLNSDFEVVGIIENAQPLSLTSRKIDAKSQYVVEVLAGKSREWGIINSETFLRNSSNKWKLVLENKLVN